jgi:hypothetical protein
MHTRDTGCNLRGNDRQQHSRVGTEGGWPEQSRHTRHR